ncbi:MAG: ribosome silencing factor [Verrucomicrobiota bacterium]
MPTEGLELAKLCKKYAEDKKCLNPVILDLSELDGPALYFFICSGMADPHLKAISEEVHLRLKEEHQIKPYSKDGNMASQWMIVDYGDVLVHIMSEEKRNYYNLESLWKDAKTY